MTRVSQKTTTSSAPHIFSLCDSLFISQTVVASPKWFIHTRTLVSMTTWLFILFHLTVGIVPICMCDGCLWSGRVSQFILWHVMAIQWIFDIFIILWWQWFRVESSGRIVAIPKNGGQPAAWSATIRGRWSSIYLGVKLNLLVGSMKSRVNNGEVVFLGGCRGMVWVWFCLNNLFVQWFDQSNLGANR